MLPYTHTPRLRARADADTTRFEHNPASDPCGSCVVSASNSNYANACSRRSQDNDPISHKLSSLRRDKTLDGVSPCVHYCNENNQPNKPPPPTRSTCVRRITLENKGRRQQALKWINNTLKEKQMIAAAKLKSQQKKDAQQANGGGGGGGRGGGGGGAKRPEMLQAAFTVSPQEIELRPRTAITFTFRGSSPGVGRLSESLCCEARVGKEKQTRQVFRTDATADFVAPLLRFSRPEFHFSHVWDPEVPMTPSSEVLEMTNTGQLPLDFTVRTQLPFSVDAAEHSLGVGEVGSLRVGFDPG